MHPYDLEASEYRLIKSLSTPQKIQDFLDVLPQNFETNGDTCRSPRGVLKEGTAHCIEGAMLAALALRLNGERPLVLDLVSAKHDDDHVVALYKRHGCWGAISKTNHAVLRYREPVYDTIRELALSYFHEYFDTNGFKTLRLFSPPINLARLDRRGWMTGEPNVRFVAKYLNTIPHYPILTRGQIATLRRADSVEISAGEIVQWKRSARLS
jgi:hypothetical protein